MIWLVFIYLSAVVLSLLLVGGKVRGSVVDPVDHFRAQLAEIDTDAQAGTIDTDAAATARLEIQRRILRAAAAHGVSDTVAGNNRLPHAAKAGVAVFFVAAAFSLYVLLGAPGVSSAAKNARIQAEERVIEEGGPTFKEAITQVQAHLALNQRDMRGWEVLARTAGAVGDYALSANAFAELALMNPQDPTWRVQEFEAYMAHAGGQITPAAQLVLAALLQIQPDHPAGQFYLGLARLQAGNENGAKAIWLALADRSSPDAPWMALVQQQLAALGVSPPKLSDADLDVVNAMTTEEREIFIVSMMRRLEQRLESAPNDPDGWMMLARSQLAMGKKKGAIATLERGIKAVSLEKSAEMQAFLDNLRESVDP